MVLLLDSLDVELVVHGKTMFMNRHNHGIGGGTTTFLQARIEGVQEQKREGRKQEMKNGSK